MTIDSILSKYAEYVSTGQRAEPYVYYSTSLYSLNSILGNGGFRGGKIVQILAENRTGKSTLALDIIAQAQKAKRECAFIDYECSYDSDYGAVLGVDNKALHVVSGVYMDKGSHITELLIESGAAVIVVDSIPAAMHASEQEQDMTEAQRMAGTSGDWTRHLKRVKMLAYKHNALVVLINQWRANLSPMARSDKKPWGAKQVQYAADYTLEMARIKNEEGKAKVSITLTKNKCAATEGHKVEVTLQHGKGFRADLDLLDAAIKMGIVNQRGAWVSYMDQKAQGLENAAQNFPLEEIRKKLVA